AGRGGRRADSVRKLAEPPLWPGPPGELRRRRVAGLPGLHHLPARRPAADELERRGELMRTPYPRARCPNGRPRAPGGRVHTSPERVEILALVSEQLTA